jgi:prevent-host-death family protein
MTSIGITQLKATWLEIVDRVERGEAFLITRRGVAVARLIPAGQRKALTPGEAVAALRDLRSGRQTPRRAMRRWVQEGRT